MGQPAFPSIFPIYARIRSRISSGISLQALLPVASLCLFLPQPSLAQTSMPLETVRERLHQSPQWAEIQAHLPNPATSTPQTLETQADILRARRFPEDAMDFYNYALVRGGDKAELMNRLGLTELEMKNVQLAKLYFERSVKLNRKNGDTWNNLGAVEFLGGHDVAAVQSYKHAVKLKKNAAIFHANLGTAYFSEKDYKGARREIASALKLDPEVYDHAGTGSGTSVHVLSSEERARLSFEMAKMYAQRGAVEQMLHSLAMASEGGLDIQHEMRKTPILAKFVVDPRVVIMVQNAQSLRPTKGATASVASPAQPLPESKPVVE